MKRPILFLIFTSFLLVNACGSKSHDKNEKLREEVIGVHDEVMPKMGQLKSLERRALSKVEEIERANPSDSVSLEEYKALAYDLSQAHDAMFVWMRQYEVEDGGKTEEELKEYLDNQMVLVTEVNVKIKDALAKAEEMLK
ncbi:hypothetical protein [Algoriphagus sp. NG3]|uniref:hypothetical protein n=1 Tax=Algoriphagus sp. NG3 TaxID=3097546 RepID=UPI002A838396|nr:hypothetical protein [Algoriphagus sp. NG3]WPR74009.1 hypothetical protein SLW71_15145 [Algoriphagus sp. NG3]